MTQGRKRKLKVRNDQELEYEKQPRLNRIRNKSEKKIKVRNLLPIKDSSGKIIHKQYKEVVEDPDPQTESPAQEKESKNIAQPVAIPKSAKALMRKRDAIINQKKDVIANVVSSVLTNPEGNIGMLKSLQSELETKEHPECVVTIRKLVTASLGCLFVDIIPGNLLVPLV